MISAKAALKLTEINKQGNIIFWFQKLNFIIKDAAEDGYISIIVHHVPTHLATELVSELREEGYLAETMNEGLQMYIVNSADPTGLCPRDVKTTGIEKAQCELKISWKK